MSGESSSGESSSGDSSSESRTHLPSRVDQMECKLPNRQDDDLMLAATAMGGHGPSPDEAVEDTKVDVEVVEEGEEAETAGPVPSSSKERADLSPATY